MFRFNNPDAFLTLLCLGAAWAIWSAVETGRTRSLLLAGVLLGVAFDTKMLQAFLVLPALALVYLWAGPPRLRRRLLQLAGAGVALFVAAGWWVAVVALWPAADRPYIGSTTNNSILSLVFGYNGLARILGTSGRGPGGGGGGGGTGFGGTPGIWRLFNASLGGEVAWLLPLAAGGLIAGLWLTRRANVPIADGPAGCSGVAGPSFVPPSSACPRASSIRTTPSSWRQVVRLSPGRVPWLCGMPDGATRGSVGLCRSWFW